MIIPVIAGCVSWIKFHTINLKEAGISVGVAFLLIISTLGISQCSMEMDSETLSGRVTQATHIPKWRAEWTELQTYTTTDSKGQTQTHTRLVTKSRTHHPKWYVETTVGRFNISQNFFNTIGQKYGIDIVRGYRPDFDSGDRNDYHSYVDDDPEFCDYPVTAKNMWRNPLKNSRSLHSFRKISDEEASKMGLPEYPQNETFVSSRLIGEHDISIWNWDKMNSAIGEEKKVNLILVKIDSIDNAKQLQQYWKGGKKNDLVICYNGEIGKPAEWCYVFGWSKNELVKLNLQTLFLDNPVNDDMISNIKQIVRKDFQPHDWTIYKGEAKVIPTGWVIAAFILMILSQAGLYYVFHHEEI
jgi:hypothetical protein